MRNLKKELLAYVNKAFDFEKTLPLRFSESHHKGTKLKAYSNRAMKKVVELTGDIELDDTGFEVEVSAVYQTPPYQEYVCTFWVSITYDEYEDFELYKQNARDLCSRLNEINDKAAHLHVERERERELVELKRLQEKYNVPSNT